MRCPDKLALQGCDSMAIMGYDNTGLVWSSTPVRLALEG